MRLRTGYSFKTCFGPLPETIKRLKALGRKNAPVSDRCSTYGFTYWEKLCRAEGLKPIYGVELAVVASLGERRPRVDWFTFFAIDSLTPLNELIYIATSNPGKTPSITYEQALAAKGLIVVTGSNPEIEHLKPQKNLFASMSSSLTPFAFERMMKKGIPFVAAQDNAFVTPEDEIAYQVAFGRAASSQSYPRHIMSDKELTDYLSSFVPKHEIGKAFKHRDALERKCKAKMEKADFLKANSKVTLETLCKRGAKKLGVNMKSKVYRDRLKRELDVIKAKEFEDYFFIIADLVAFAKPLMVVGPARGSSCGSLVCFLLGITTIDPIEYDLIFERFIDLNRSDWPDIDIDFSDEKRHLVFEYAEEKYGADHVARLGSVGLFKSKSVINQAGYVLEIPKFKMDKLADAVGTAFDGDEGALRTVSAALEETDIGRDLVEEYPEIVIAGRLEGHPTNAGQHAAGVLITNKPIFNHVAVNAQTGAAMCNKKDAETLGLLKIDALGLSQLSVFERCLELIGEAPVSGWLEKLPLDDPKAFEVINQGKLAGVFQLTGRALRGLSQGITFETIDDIVAITALARPGPLSTGGAQAWAKRRMGKERVRYPHEAFKQILEPTKGVITYQEQVMQMAREVGQMEWEDVTGLRKAIGVKLGREVIDTYRAKWIKGGKKSGVPEDTLNAVWNDILAYGAYAFNKSHSVAYAMISYWCCWLKAYHPAEYAAAMLDGQKDPDKQILLLRELAQEGIDYVAFDKEASGDRWSVKQTKKGPLLIGPLTNAHGIGKAAAREIITARGKGEEVRPALAKRINQPITKIDTISPVADFLKSVDLEALHIVSKITPINKVEGISEHRVMVIGVATKITKGNDNEPERIERRGYRISGPSDFLAVILADDTEDMLCRISRKNYARLASKFDEAVTDKSVFAIKGRVPEGFRMIDVEAVRYIGEME